ncbi:MAG: ArsA-related P-loop ATPase [Anaerolineae bacterium]
MSLARIFHENPERRYIMYGGKGGLGKTTFSAATAYWLAQQGHKVLVFSVDPQASLTDIFQQDIFGKGPVEIMPNLYAQEIDADRHIQEYQEEIRQKIREMYGFEQVPEEIESYIQAAAAEPAMEESAIFDKVVVMTVSTLKLLRVVIQLLVSTVVFIHKPVPYQLEQTLLFNPIKQNTL